MRHVVVIGGGLAATRTVEELRARGEGIQITVVSAEPVEPYDRPPLSKRALTGELPAPQLRKDWGELDLDLRLGVTATGLDTTAHTVMLDDGSVLDYDALVIATGATPRAFPGLSGAGVHVLRTASDAAGLAADARAAGHLTILGAGFIGCEVAATLRGEDLEVDLVEALPFPLARVLGEQVGRRVAAEHERHGVRLHLGAAVERIEGEGAARELILAGGGRVAGDVVLVAIGVHPELGWLAGSGLAIEDGVVCDAHGRTSAPDVWAAGDVASWHHPGLGAHVRLEHWTSAADHGVAVARDLLGMGEPHAEVPYFWSDQYGLKWQMLGRPAADDDVTLLDVGPDGDRLLAVYGRGARFTAVLGGGVPRLVMRMRGLLADGATYDAALELARS